MKIVAFIPVVLMATSAFGQEPPSDPKTQNPSSPAQTASSTGPQQQQPTADRTAIEVKPGSPVIKQKDLWDQTGYLHPFVRMPKYILQDQKAIWTSPAHTAKQDIKLWAIFGTVTGVLIATDRHTVNALPNSSSQVSVSNWASRLGSAYTLIPAGAAFYLIGTPTHQERFRETGLLSFEALIDANLVGEAVKIVTDRARPLESDGHGHFEDSPNGRWSSSFPSGHAISTWTMASVIAHQYPHPRIVPIVAYALAGTVVVARVGARRHFPGDVVAGSAMGWFIGDYVYGRRHNSELDHKPTFSEKLLDHVHLGLEM